MGSFIADMERKNLLEHLAKELETILAQYVANHPPEKEKSLFLKGCYTGYTGGLRRAINTINYEIGIRQDRPNINHPGERP
jgi:hypothetical protein